MPTQLLPLRNFQFFTLTYRIISIAATTTKICYPFFMTKYTFFSRYIVGIFITLTGVLFLYIGLCCVSLFLVYISAGFISMGNVILYLTYLTFMKHFPNGYLSTYLIGNYSGGMCVTLIYFGMRYIGVSFTSVILNC